MHLPEPALARRGLGGAGDEGRAGMGALVGEVAEDIDEPLAEGLAQPVEHGAQAAAIGAEIVAVDHDADDAVGGAPAAHMIPRRDRSAAEA